LRCHGEWRITLDVLANKDFRYLTKISLLGMLKEEDWLD
jgi:hypothetical protein